MTAIRRKKVTKYRSHTTHGGGHRKKRRGAGSRGGRGNAGSGKRAGHKTFGKKLGKHGFTRGGNNIFIKAVNIGYFTLETLEKLVQKGKAVKQGDAYILDLPKLGFQKLLGTGNTNVKLHLSVPYFSARAEEKIKTAGGMITAEPEKVSEPSNKEKEDVENKKEN